MSENKQLMKNGMWNNPALVQLLGLCPLLAVSSTITNAGAWYCHITGTSGV